MLNQRQIKNLVFADVTSAEAAGRPDEICYVQETKTFYNYLIAGSTYTVDHLSVLSTGNGGDTRWIANAGQYVFEYDTVYIDAAGMIPCTTNGALQGTKEYGTNDIDIDYFSFGGGVTKERVQFKLKMQPGWDRGTVKAKFDWSSASGSTTNDTVEWAIKAGAISDNDTIDTALGTAQVISDVLLADNGTKLQTTTATPAITITGAPALGDVIVFEIYRNTDGTDDMAENAYLFGCTIQYRRTNVVTAW